MIDRATQLAGRSSMRRYQSTRTLSHDASLLEGIYAGPLSWRGGVIRGIGPVQKDYGALAIDSTTGQASASGDIAPIETLSSLGRTMLAAVGVDPGVITSQITAGRVIASAFV